jgi:hypothetical protein
MVMALMDIRKRVRLSFFSVIKHRLRFIEYINNRLLEYSKKEGEARHLNALELPILYK